MNAFTQGKCKLYLIALKANIRCSHFLPINFQLQPRAVLMAVHHRNINVLEKQNFFFTTFTTKCDHFNCLNLPELNIN